MQMLAELTKNQLAKIAEDKDIAISDNWSKDEICEEIARHLSKDEVERLIIKYSKIKVEEEVIEEQIKRKRVRTTLEAEKAEVAREKAFKYPRQDTMIVQLIKCCDGRGIHKQIIQKVSQDYEIGIEMHGKTIDLHYQRPELLRFLYTIFLSQSGERSLQYRFANYLLWKDHRVKQIELEKPITGFSGNVYKVDVYGFDPQEAYDVYVECRGKSVDADDIKEIKQEVEDIAKEGKYSFDRVILVCENYKPAAIRAINAEVIKLPDKNGIGKHLVRLQPKMQRIVTAIGGVNRQIELYQERKPSEFVKIK
jgi:hypothetical protein